jgi:hypothetical protein
MVTNSKICDKTMLKKNIRDLRPILKGSENDRATKEEKNFISINRGG